MLCHAVFSHKSSDAILQIDRTKQPGRHMSYRVTVTSLNVESSSKRHK